MTKEEIELVIINYDKLIKLAKEKINVIQELDNKYNTARGIEEISFEGNMVYVKCDDSCRGCYDSLYFNFPIDYLSIDNQELQKIVINAKELEIESKRIAEEEKQLKEKQATALRELEQYRKLKAKFEYKTPTP